MNKTIVYYMLLMVVILSSCTESLNPSGMVDHVFSADTRGADPEFYYWYHEKKIDLTVNKDYVNIVIDTTQVKHSDVASLCEELGLEAQSDPDGGGLFMAKYSNPAKSFSEYQFVVEELRGDPRIMYVFPFFEGEKGTRPTGTSQIFYVQLKELVPEEKLAEEVPFIEKEYDLEALEEEAKRVGVCIVRAVDYMPDWYILSVKGSRFNTSLDAANCMYETGRFEAIDPAFMFEFEPYATNDPLFSQQWGLKNTSTPGYDVNVEGAWAISTGANIKVAVIDTGIAPNHPDLSGNLSSNSYDSFYGTPCTGPGDDHGTHVAGIIAAVGNNNLQIAGVAYNSTLLRVDNPLVPMDSLQLSKLASGVSWAWLNNADVINCSWGINSANGLTSSLLENAISYALTNGRSDKGSVVVFASGKDGGSNIGYPGSFDSRILVVGSIGSTGYRSSSFSNYGSALDVVAPGEDILSTIPNSGTDYMSGTSMAAPHVSGVAALMLSANPQLTREEVVRIIQHTAKKISPGSPGTYLYYPRDYMFADETWNQEVGHGLVDATAAVAMGQAMATIPSVSDTGMDVMVSCSPTNNYHYYTISGGSFPKIVTVSLLPAQINPSYTYFWRLTTEAYPNWTPTLTFADDYLANIDVPAPSITSTLYIQCFIYNGSTLVDVPSYALTVIP